MQQPNHPDEVTFGEELRVGRKAMTKIKVTPAGFPYQYYQEMIDVEDKLLKGLKNE